MIFNAQIGTAPCKIKPLSGYFLSVSLLVMLCGCMHFSRLEISPDDSTVLVKDANVLKQEIGDLLAASRFAPVRDRRFEEEKHAQPGFVDEWERFENRGFWNGTEYIRVEMYRGRNSILLVVSSGKNARGAVVEGIGAMLKRSISEKHPDLKVYVSSSSYFPLWAP